MTKPLVDNGIFRRVADCPTPWPCFVIAVRNEVLETENATIKSLLKVINEVTSQFKQTPNLVPTLAKAFAQKPQDVADWLSLTEWSQKPLDENMLNKVQNQLHELSLIDKKGTFAGIATAL